MHEALSAAQPLNEKQNVKAERLTKGKRPIEGPQPSTSTGESSVQHSQNIVEPSVEDILEPPARSPGGRTEDERVAEMEEEILHRNKIYEQEKAKIERDNILQEERRKERQRRRQENDELRKSLETLSLEELSERVNNLLTYLQNIWNGTEFSQRCDDFKKGGRPYQLLLYSANTYPFTEEQVDVVLKVLSARWMRDKEEQLRHYDFIDKDTRVSILSNDCFFFYKG